MIQQRDKILAMMGIMLWGMIFGQPLHAASEESPLSEPPSMPEISVNESQDKEQKAQEYNAQAIQLFEKGQFQEAHELWEKALKLLEYPETVEETRDEGDVRAKETPAKESTGEALSSTKEEWRKTLEESEKEQQRRLNKQVEPIYQRALDYYQKRQFPQAKEHFKTIEKLLPDYKLTPEYLERIDQDIEEEAKQLLDEQLKIETLNRNKEKEEWLAALEESEKYQQKQLQVQAESIYQVAVDYYKRGQFNLAKDYFQEVEGIVPDYKSTAEYLARIDKDIEDQELYQQQLGEKQLEQKLKQHQLEQKNSEGQFYSAQKQTLVDRIAHRQQLKEQSKIPDQIQKQQQNRSQEEAEFLYQQARDHYKRRAFEEAKKRFEEIERILPNYKSTQRYLGRIDRDIEQAQQTQQRKVERTLLRKIRQSGFTDGNQPPKRESLLKTEEKKRREMLKKEAAFVYQKAVFLYQTKNYQEAKRKFIELQRLFPNYRSTAQYLARIEEDIELEKERRFEEQQRAFAAQMRKEKLAQRKQLAERQPMSQDRGHLIVQKAVEERRKKIGQEAEEKYQEALAFYKAKNFIEAKRKFIQVEAIVPDYQSTQEYLSRIDEDIEKQDHDGTPSSLDAAQEIYQQALALYKAGKLVEAREKFFEVDRLVPGYKTTKGYLSRLDRDIGNRNRDMERQRRKEAKLANRPLQEKRKESKNNIEKEYKEAVKAYKRGQFDLAEDKLNQSESYLIAGGFEQDYLVKMQKKIKKTREQLAKRPDQREDKTRSLSIEMSPIEVSSQPESQQPIRGEQIAAGEDEQSEFARAINTQQGRIRAERAKVRQQFVKELEHLYKNAITLYKSGDHQKAKALFLEIDQVWPGYENVKYYLTKLEKKAEIPPTKKRSEVISGALDSLQ